MKNKLFKRLRKRLPPGVTFDTMPPEIYALHTMRSYGIPTGAELVYGVQERYPEYFVPYHWWEWIWFYMKWPVRTYKMWRWRREWMSEKPLSGKGILSEVLSEIEDRDL